MLDQPLTRFEPVDTLEEMYLTLSPRPLITLQELEAFYRPEINQMRGEDKMLRLKLGLKRATETSYYKGCLMGHPGVGKSTELTRLIYEKDIEKKFKAIRFSVLSDLDPLNFHPLDVVLLMVAEVVEKTDETTGKRPQDATLQRLKDWYNQEEVTRKENEEGKIGIEAGAGVKDNSLWNQVLGLFASVKGELRFASSREKKVVEYRVRRFNELIAIANRLLVECNQILLENEQRQWLFIGEDFDKSGVSTEAIKSLFIEYGNIFKDLKLHLIFNIPIGLYNSAAGIRLLFPFEQCHLIPDTTVFAKDHQPNLDGQNALRKVLEARVNLKLFAEDQVKRLIIASGGNIRDLFALVNYAADTALLDEREMIDRDDVTVAIGNLRTEYERRLGESLLDKKEISYQQKAELLKRIYDQDEQAQVPNEILYVLLYCRAIQELNEGEGERCFGVHPLVVDLLNAQGIIPFSSSGGVAGGTI
ncbi:MAG: hypothetical protein AB4041_03655 [Microcystaceae cyanobacterium]